MLYHCFPCSIFYFALSKFKNQTKIKTKKTKKNPVTLPRSFQENQIMGYPKTKQNKKINSLIFRIWIITSVL